MPKTNLQLVKKVVNVAAFQNCRPQYAIGVTVPYRAFALSSSFLSKNYYEILGVTPDASQTEIKEAYYKLSKIYHPDIAPDESSLKTFRELTEAYDVLNNIKSRKLYDKGAVVKPKVEGEYDASKSAFYEGLFKQKIKPEVKKEGMPVQFSYDQYCAERYTERRDEVWQIKNKFYMEDYHSGVIEGVGELRRFFLAALYIKMFLTYIFVFVI